MKITTKEIRSLVREAFLKQIKESSEVEKQDDKKLNAFLDKASKALEDNRKKLFDLVEEGEKLLLEDFQSSDLKQMVTHCVGILKKVHGLCNGACEAVKKLY